MCRFKLVESRIIIQFTTFQYILCVGSSIDFYRNAPLFLEFQYILCVGSSNYAGVKWVEQEEFQYILCVGSSCTLVLIR